MTRQEADKLRKRLMVYVQVNESIIKEAQDACKTPDGQMGYLSGKREAFNDALQIIEEMVS